MEYPKFQTGIFGRMESARGHYQELPFISCTIACVTAASTRKKIRGGCDMRLHARGLAKVAFNPSVQQKVDLSACP